MQIALGKSKEGSSLKSSTASNLFDSRKSQTKVPNTVSDSVSPNAIGSTLEISRTANSERLSLWQQAAE